MAPPQDGTPQRIESGKQRALRIPLDYYKGWDRLQWTKVILTGVALAASLLWWGIGFATPDRGQLKYSHGTLANVHAPLDADCTACHVPWHPITGQKGPAQLFFDVHASDARCEVCHGPGETQRGSGGTHHKSQKKEDTNSCGGCHRDHHGRDFSLTHLADADCTSCHRDMKAHMNGSPHFANTVIRFDKDHPQFSAVKNPGSDPGKLKFNHALHMAAGLFPDGSPESGFTYARLGEADRVLYGWKPGEDLKRAVQLDCGSCHQTVAKGPGVNLLDEPYGPSVAKRLDGAYMQPITHGNQCRACHPITDHLNNPLSHGLQPSELQKELTRALANSRTKVAASSGEKRVIPGNALSAEQAREETAEDQMRKAQRFLYLGRANCGECHYYEGPKDRDVPEKIIPPDLPTVWFQHALFNHKVHTDKKIDCRECHANAYTSKDHSDILVPGVENCKQCHAEGGKTTDGKTPRYDCTECHRYHHGEPAFMAVRTQRGRPPQRDPADLLLELAGEKHGKRQ